MILSLLVSDVKGPFFLWRCSWKRSNLKLYLQTVFLSQLGKYPFGFHSTQIELIHKNEGRNSRSPLFWYLQMFKQSFCFFCLNDADNSTILATCCYCCCCLTSMYYTNVVPRSQASHKVRDVSLQRTKCTININLTSS